jgi:hypothetical protein
MEFIIILFIIFIGYLLISYYSKKKSISIQKFDLEAAIKAAEERANYKKLKDDYTKQNSIVKSKESIDNLVSTEIIEKDYEKHTEKIWKDLGYRVKKDETYFSKFYGKELFTSDQVEIITHTINPLQLEYGLKPNQKKVKQLGYSLVNKVQKEKQKIY